MKDESAEVMLKHIEREIKLLRTKNELGGYDYNSWSDKKECERLINLSNDIIYFRKKYDK